MNKNTPHKLKKKPKNTNPFYFQVPKRTPPHIIWSPRRNQQYFPAVNVSCVILEYSSANVLLFFSQSNVSYVFTIMNVMNEVFFLLFFYNLFTFVLLGESRSRTT